MNASELAVPVADRHFEDYAPGAVFEYGEIPVTEAEIIEFARRFDDLNIFMSTTSRRPTAPKAA